MPKDYAKKTSPSKQHKSKNKRRTTKEKGLGKKQGRTKSQNQSYIGLFWLVLVSVILLVVCLTFIGWLWYSSSHVSSSPSDKMAVTVRHPDYQRSHNESNNMPELPVKFQAVHNLSHDLGNSCTSQSKALLFFTKPSAQQQPIVNTLINTSKTPIHKHLHLSQVTMWSVGPSQLTNLRTLQKQLFKHQIYAVINCRP